MMTMRRMVTPMSEEYEDNYDIDDLVKANAERKYGDPDDANDDNSEAVDMKDADKDDVDMDGPNSDDTDGSDDNITKASDANGSNAADDADADNADANHNAKDGVRNYIYDNDDGTDTKTLTLMTLMIQTISMTRFGVWCGPSLPYSTELGELG